MTENILRAVFYIANFSFFIPFCHPLIIRQITQKGSEKMLNSTDSTNLPWDYEQVMATAQCITEHLQLYGMENPRIFKIKGNQSDAVKDAFHKDGLSFLELKNKNYVLVEQLDYQHCNEIAEREYVKQSCFLQEFDANELEKIIAEHPKIPNKEFLQIKNLSSTEINLLLNSCNNIKPGLLIETSQQEHGEYLVSIPCGLLTKQDRENLVAIYIESSIAAFGINYIARKEENFTVENYEAQLKEHFFCKQVISAVNEKLKSAGLTGDNFTEYFKSVSYQTSYILTQLQKKHELSGFTQKQQESLQNAYKELPADSYMYTADKIMHHEISSKKALRTRLVHLDLDMSQKEQER